MDKRLHRVVAGPDPVTGEFRMACGRKGYPRGMAEYDGEGQVWRAVSGYARVTCSRCKVHLRGDMAKVVRALLDLGSAKLLRANAFDWSRSPPRIFCRPQTGKALARRGLISRVDNDTWRLGNGVAILARDLPPNAEEEF